MIKALEVHDVKNRNKNVNFWVQQACHFNMAVHVL
jgi:hypothetical protein